MPSTGMILVTGEHVGVDGAIEEVGKKLSDAARSGSGTLAWLTQVEGDEPIAVNPAHVVILRHGDD
jgi:hypothetical protein